MEPKLATSALLSLAAGYLMLVAGMKKRALEWRRMRRRCPSCERLRPDCRCRA